MFGKFFAMGAVMLIGGLLFGATALAQGPYGPGGAYRGEETGPYGPGGANHGEQSFMAVAAEKLGLTRVQLVEELQAGKTIAQVAEEKGVAPETIVNAFVETHKEWLDARVADGRLTAEQAAERLAAAEAQATEHLTQALPFEGERGRGAGVCAGDPGAKAQQMNGQMGRFGQRGR